MTALLEEVQVTHAAPLASDALQESTTRLIRRGAGRLELGATWAEDTARVVLAQPAVRDALDAVAVLEHIAERHRPIRWAADSDIEVCPSCHVGAPCEEAVLLGIASPTDTNKEQNHG